LRYGPAIARPSHIRPALAEVLAVEGRHDWTIEELREALARRGVPADFSSVFRALRQLESAGEVLRIDLGDGRARFEPVGEHHEHVRCDLCGAVEPVPGCLVEESVVERQTGFSITGHRLLFAGICPRCRARSPG
jgi:Fur family transcriptional regulator, peroxide stress response regulator